MLSYSRFYAHYYIFSIREEQQNTRKGLELEDNYMIKQQTIVFKKSIYIECESLYIVGVFRGCHREENLVLFFSYSIKRLK